MKENIYKKLTYAEKAGLFLKNHLQAGKENASKEDKKGYRDKFAESIGVTKRTLDRYCVAINEIDTLEVIAEALGVSVRDMLFDDEDVPLPIEFWLQKWRKCNGKYL